MKRALILAAAVTLASCADDPRQRAVDAMLEQPATAKFRNLQERGDLLLCGEVDARLPAGGLSGFRRFMAYSDGTVMIDGDPPRLHYPSGEPAADLLQRVDAKIEALRRINAAGSTASPAEVDRQALRIWFDRRWSNACEFRR